MPSIDDILAKYRKPAVAHGKENAFTPSKKKSSGVVPRRQALRAQKPAAQRVQAKQLSANKSTASKPCIVYDDNKAPLTRSSPKKKALMATRIPSPTKHSKPARVPQEADPENRKDPGTPNDAENDLKNVQKDLKNDGKDSKDAENDLKNVQKDLKTDGKECKDAENASKDAENDINSAGNVELSTLGHQEGAEEPAPAAVAVEVPPAPASLDDSVSAGAAVPSPANPSDVEETASAEAEGAPLIAAAGCASTEATGELQGEDVVLDKLEADAATELPSVPTEEGKDVDFGVFGSTDNDDNESQSSAYASAEETLARKVMSVATRVALPWSIEAPPPEAVQAAVESMMLELSPFLKYLEGALTRAEQAITEADGSAAACECAALQPLQSLVSQVSHWSKKDDTDEVGTPLESSPGGEEKVETSACESCGRMFNLASLARHSVVCKKVFGREKRAPFSVVRVPDDPDEDPECTFQPRINAKSSKAQSRTCNSNARAKSPKKSMKTASNIASVEYIACSKCTRAFPADSLSRHENVCTARPKKALVSKKDAKVPRAVRTSKAGGLRNCPHCTRTFGPRAIERHVEICQNNHHKPKPPPKTNRYADSAKIRGVPMATRSSLDAAGGVNSTSGWR